ncbi:nucleotidyl transferase [Moorena producens PAL-8-15-08-1]|uniref:Nucleotidyl transferase n=1 Tax=Moorena producens PAL-8-15-08-1 TaxID=1458985 RepID=A0A1D8U256_9CYAN|nr:nucleotidyltransferase family protein [Moorena producens]AOX03987.1 nucleotidyl transferase [Moorena producens PAL-8-15-08-1]
MSQCNLTEAMTYHTHSADNRWQQALLPMGSTLEQAIRNLDQSTLQIALLITAEGALVGTVTDGDIRRGLLRGLDLQSSVDAVVNRNPIVAPPGLRQETMLQIMQANGIQQLPVVDESRRVVGLYLLDELVNLTQRPNTMVIMAGGKGTRLRPLTENCPKPLLPVAGKPMLEHIIERASSEGFQHFVISIHYLGEMIEEYFSDGSRWQVQIDYLREDSPLGTAGAISLLQNRPEVPFIVTNGDVLTDIRYGEMVDFHIQHRATATMAVRLHEWQNPFGVVNTKGVDIVGFDEKPVVRTHVNAGIYILNPSALDELNPGEHCDMPVLFSRLQEHCHRTIVYPIHEAWLDVGREEDFQRAQVALSGKPSVVSGQRSAVSGQWSAVSRLNSD